MDKWTLLFLSVLATIATAISYAWWRGMLKRPDSDIENVIGYDGSDLPPAQRAKMADRMAHLDILGVPVIFFGTLMVALITKTINAFFP